LRKFLVAVLAIFIGIIAILGYQISQPDSNRDTAPEPSQSAQVPQGEGLEGYYTQQLEWSGCNAGFECSTFNVPIDYANPADGALQISVIRKLATGSAIGSRLRVQLILVVVLEHFHLVEMVLN